MKVRNINLSLYNRLLIIIFLLALFPLVVLSFFGYKMFSNVMLEMIAESNFKTVNQIELQYDKFYDDLNDILTRVSIDPDVQKMMSEMTTSEWNSYLEARTFSDYCNNLLVSHSEVSNISIINFKGKRIDSLGRSLPIKKNEKITNLSEQLKTNSLAISSVQHTESGQNQMSFGKMIVDVNSGKPLGIVILDLDLDILSEKFKKLTLLKSGYVYIVNQQNQIIFHPFKNIGQKMKQLPTREGSYFLKKNPNGEEFLYLIKKSSTTDWVFTGIIPYKEVTDKNLFIRNAFLIFLLLMLLALFFVAILLKKVLVTPIKKLQLLMNQVQEGNFRVRASFQRKDEIGKLFVAFNSMVTQINNLIERVYQVELNESRALLLQKQAELDALQERITPHFLYNTLNSISWFANQKGIREIQFVIDSLSSMLRYSVGNGANLVRLIDEFNYIKLYAEIMDFRFEGSITFMYSLPSFLEDVLIPRLSLQPIVENAVKYAFSSNKQNKRIQIIAAMEEEVVHITVEDNGDGISLEKTNEINTYLNHVKPELANTGHVCGMGLHNVHQRLKLTFGDIYGISITSRVGVGTMVTVSLPIRVKKIS